MSITALAKDQIIINMQFPMKLHVLLQNAELKGVTSIISWLPDGRSFKVHNKDKFSKLIMPEYFTASKYKSFQRSLNLWGFETVSKGPEKGVCSHPFFVRGDPAKTQMMKRVKVKSNEKTPPRKCEQSRTEEEQASLSLLSLNGTTTSSTKSSRNILPPPVIGRWPLGLVHQFANVAPTTSVVQRDIFLEQAISLELLAQRERALLDAISVIKSARQLLGSSTDFTAFGGRY
jgi:hypothetical protein